VVNKKAPPGGEAGRHLIPAVGAKPRGISDYWQRFLPRSSLGRRSHGASWVAVLLARAKGHHGDAGDFAIGVSLEVGVICLEQSHLDALL